MWRRYGSLGCALVSGARRFLLSRMLPLFLLAFILISTVVGGIVPQKRDLTAEQYSRWKAAHPAFVSACERLRLTDIHISWWFIAAVCLLAVSIMYCTLRRLRWSLAGTGSAVFHLSFILLLAGVLLTRLTRVDGTLVLAEGETMLGPLVGQDRRGRPVHFQPEREVRRVKLNKVSITRDARQVVTRYESHLGIGDGEGNISERVILVNRPLVHDGVVFMLDRYGLAPHFVVEKAGENGGFEKILDSYVNLVVVGKGTEDHFVVPGSKMTVRVRFNQDFLHPALEVEANSGEAILVRGTLEIPGIIKREGIRITVDELRYWNGFLLHRERGKGVLYFGLWAAVAGLVMRFLPLVAKGASA